VLAAFGTWIWRAQKGLDEALRVNHFSSARELPVEIKDVVDKTLGTSRMGTVYRGDRTGS
jgi:hypothetical protein